MIWFTQCRFCQFMVLCNEISDRSILYQKCLSEIHNKLNCVRWEVDTPEKMRNQSWQKNEVEYNCCLTIWYANGNRIDNTDQIRYWFIKS